MTEIDRARSSTDDEVGVNLLTKPTWPARPNLAINSYEQEIADAYFRQASGSHALEQLKLNQRRHHDLGSRRYVSGRRCSRKCSG